MTTKQPLDVPRPTAAPAAVALAIMALVAAGSAACSDSESCGPDLNADGRVDQTDCELRAVGELRRIDCAASPEAWRSQARCATTEVHPQPESDAPLVEGAALLRRHAPAFARGDVLRVPSAETPLSAWDVHRPGGPSIGSLLATTRGTVTAVVGTTGAWIDRDNDMAVTPLELVTFGDAFGGTPTEAVASRDGATVIAALVDGRLRVWHDLGDDQQLGANEVLDLGPISYVVDVTSSPPSVTYRPASGDLVRWRPGPGWTLPGTTDAALEVDPQCRVRISARFCRGSSGILRFGNGSLDQLAWPPATQFLDVVDERLLVVIGGDQHRVWHDLDDDLVEDPDELSSLRLPPHHRLADLRPNYTSLTPMFDAAGAPITYVGLISVPERGYFRISRRRATRFLGDACSGADACADELRCLPTSDDRGVCALPAPL